MLIYVDTTSKSLVISPNDVRRCLPPKITAGDTVPVTLAFLQRNPQPLNTGQPVYTYLDFSSAGVELSVGPAGSPPTGGFWTLAFMSSTTPELAWNISSYDLAAAINAMADVVTAGGVTVTGNAGGPWQVTFNNFGIQNQFTSPNPGLLPGSTVVISSDNPGSTTLQNTFFVALEQIATVIVSSWTPQAAAAIAVTQLQANVIQRVSIPAGTYGGSFTLTLNGNTTAAIPFAAQLDVVAAAIAALPGGTGVTVWPGNNFWDITIPSNTFAFTGNAAGLIIPLTLTGSLQLVQSQLMVLLAKGSPILVPFLIKITNPTTQTFFDYLIQISSP